METRIRALRRAIKQLPSILLPDVRRLLDTRLGVLVPLIATSLFLQAGPTHAQPTKETFPRLANFPIRYSKGLADPEYRQRLARFDLVVLGMWKGYAFPDLATGTPMGVADIVADIDRRARQMGNGDILIGKYTAFNESSDDPDNSAKADQWDKLHSETGPGYPRNNDWWARDRNGNNTSSWPGQWLTNVTEFVRRDGNGDTYPEWKAERDYVLFFRDIPELDIWYFDNWFYRPRVNADWDGDGNNDDRDDPEVRRYFRVGYANGLARARKLAPDKIFIGNVDGNSVSNVGMLTEPEFRGKLSALYEAAMGLDHSAETWGGWDVMMEQYQTTLANAQYKLAILHATGKPDDYAMMRYGLASALMDNGYYMYSSTIKKYTAQTWFDEYEIDLGRPVDPPQFDPWQKGVYMRRFEKGMALVNPKGNGRRTVQIEAGYRRINGQQDPRTNNGQPAGSVTLDERDGIILVRTDGSTNEVKRPKPPVLN